MIVLCFHNKDVSLTSRYSVGVYVNWAAFDPWFMVRMLLHGWHPNSPWSHPTLTRRAFFSDDYPESKLIEFQRRTNRYEAFLWPFSMMKPFAHADKVMTSVSGWGGADGPNRVLVLTGDEDKLMTKSIMESLASKYRDAFRHLVVSKKLEAKVDDVKPLDGKGVEDTEGEGVRLAWVPGAAHHLQNDVTWEVGAQKLLDFYLQL